MTDINKTRSAKITKQLGVNKATAYNRLVKNILFDLVKKSNRDICFRCGNKIESFKEFSI